MKKFATRMFACGMAAAVMFGGSLPAFASDSNESTAEEEVSVVGGWNAEAADIIPEEAEDAFEKALDGLVGVIYEPVQLLASQVVAGTNYAFLCRSTVVYPGAVPEYCIVTVYADLEGNASIEEIQELISVSMDEDGEWSVIVPDNEDSLATIARERIGYAYYDFDFDGKDELILSITPENDEKGAYLLDMYTRVEDQVVNVFSSEKDSRFFITDLTGEGDYAFYSIGDTNSESYEYKAYAFYDEIMHLSQAVRYDGQAEESWMMGYEENGELIYNEVIDEEMGKAIIETAENYKVMLEMESWNNTEN